MTFSESRERFDSGSASRNTNNQRLRDGDGRWNEKRDGVVSDMQDRMSYYERKYRKSKRRVKRLISDNVTEKNKNQELHSNHCNLVAQYEVLEKTKQLLHKAQLARLSHFFTANMKHKSLQASFSALKLSSKLHSALLSERLCHFTFLKLSRLLKSLRTHATLRKHRRHQRKHLKLRTNLLKHLLYKHFFLTPLRPSFTHWRVNTSGLRRIKAVEEMVRKDIGSATQQVTLMRQIIACTKLDKVWAVREKLNKMRVFQAISDQSSHHDGKNHRKLRKGLSRNTMEEFGERISRSRMQQGIVEGIEKIYQIQKRRQGESKKNYFQKWQYIAYDDIMGQLDQSNEVLFQLH